MNNIKELYFDRIDSPEGIGVNETSASKKCDICRHWYFLYYSFKFQQNACNRCHDSLMISMNLSNIAILNIKGSDYRCISSLIRKNETTNLIQNADLTEKLDHYKSKHQEQFWRCKFTWNSNSNEESWNYKLKKYNKFWNHIAKQKKI